MRKDDDTAVSLESADYAQSDLTADRIMEFLRLNPDFLAENAQTIAEMAPPTRWIGDGVVDLQRFLLERQREDLDQLRLAAQEVIETSRGNMSSQTRTHSAVLALLSAHDFEHMLRIINDDLPLLLDLDVVTIGFEPGDNAPQALTSAHIQPFQPGEIEDIMGSDHDVRLFKEIEENKAVFGSAASLVRSAALMRLRPSRKVPPGLIALGARSPNFFHPRQGTELVTFIARVIERCAHRWLEKQA
jgi:hypothetical protein